MAEPGGRTVNWFIKKRRVPTQPDPARFGDPLALQTEWTSLTGGSGSPSRGLQLANIPGGMEYRMTRRAVIQSGAFVLTGLLLLYLAGPYQSGSLNPAQWGKDGLFIAIFGFFLAALGGCIPLINTQHARRFNIAEQIFTCGEKSARLFEIAAIQLIPAPGDEYLNFQINLVCSDAQRLHVINLPSPEAARSDAETLSLLIGCKVWDAL